MKEDLYDDLLNEKEEKTDFQALFFKYIIHWPWFVASVLICTGLAFAYLRYQIPVYEVSSSILIKEDDKKSTNNALSAMQDFGMLSMTSNFDNELEILKYKSNCIPSDPRKLFFLKLTDRSAVKYICARCWQIKTPHYIHESGLAGARRPHDCHVLSLLNLE